MTPVEGERLARLEEQVKNIISDMAEAKAAAKETSAMVTELRDLMLKGIGAKWAIVLIVSAATTIGFLAAHFLPFWIPYGK